MELISKSEKHVEKLLKSLKLPKLPNFVRKWLGVNVWWIAAVFAVLLAISALIAIGSLFTRLNALALVPSAWLVVSAVAGWAIVSSIINIVFSAAEAVLLGLAVNPLQLKQKKGWTLLYIVLLLGALSVVAGLILSMLTLNILTFIGGLLFGAIWLIVYAYILFEIRGEFAHVEKSAGVKSSK